MRGTKFNRFCTFELRQQPGLKSSLLTIFSILGFVGVYGQSLSNFREKKFLIKSDSTRIDTLSISPETFELNLSQNLADTALFNLDPATSTLIWNGPYPEDSVIATYRVIPLDLSKAYSKRSTSIIQPENQYFIAPNTFRPQMNTDPIFGSTKLNKTGSISRGVGFGNNQDLTVNSSLSLQLNGKLTDKINILASVTDDNIPIQPDGNTAQLQEFDQVYIQLYDDKSKLTVGDFFVKKPLGYFTSYYKRAQGASFKTRLPLSDNKYLFTESSMAVSRGKFARNILRGQEGNQGPYRLRGNEGEQFIVILAGTERVFIDGKEMIRGQENDYTIDYNTAEITFTAKQLVNKDKRIAVEFQYTDATYVRSMVQTSTGIESDKYTAYINFYSEQDAKNQPLQQDLSDSDKRILAQAGDDTQSAIAPSYSEVGEFKNDQILYTVVDTLGYDSVFVRTQGEGDHFYNVNFSEVGQGNGDYIQDGFDASGRVFRWIAPDTTLEGNIVRNGTHAPVRLLIAPKKTQMLMGGIKYKFSEKTKVEVETGFSNNDVNTFSDKGNGDNYSHGLFAKMEHEQPLSSKPDGATLTGKMSLESIGKNFQPIEPYRSVEFNRNWNLTSDLNALNQNILTGGLVLKNKKQYNVDYTLDRFEAGNAYEGTKSSLVADIELDGFNAWFNGSILNTDGIEKSRFARHKSRIEKDLWFTKLGFKDERENNSRFITGTDSLSANAYKFYDWQFYFTNLDTSKIGYRVFYRERTDFATNLNDYKESTHAVNYGAEISLVNNPRNQFKATVSNRILEITDAELTDQAPESTLLARLEHILRLAKNAITSNIYYEIGSGLERRQEFFYIQDPTGQGPYTWIDYNDNGVKELNEFELARPEDGDRYIRVSSPTDTYERAYSNQYSQSLNLNPMSIWGNETGLKKILSKFSNQLAYRIQRKTRREDGANRYNPFLDAIGDSALISQSSSIRNTFFFNRTSSKFGMDYTYTNQFSKNPLTTGFEQRDTRSHTFRVRYNFTPKYGIIIEQELGERKSDSDIIEGRSYNIGYWRFKPTLTYQPGTTFRLSLIGDITEKKNAENLGGEEAMLVDFGLDFRLSKVESGTFFAQINLINIDYNGTSNNSLAYEMLNGLNNGKNITWAAGIQRNLGKNLQLSLSYNGRKSEEAKAVHTGNAQVRAFF